MINVIDIKEFNVLTPISPATPNFYWQEVLQNNLKAKGYEKYNFNVIMDLKVLYNILLQAQMIQEFREWYNRPIEIESWYRPDLYNDVVLPENGYASTRTSDHKCKESSACDTNAKATDKNIWKWKQICDKYGVSWSIGRYSWGLHLGWRRNQPNRMWWYKQGT